MSASTAAAPVAEPSTAEPGPRITLHVLRGVAVVHTLCAVAQPTLAGVYMGGEIDALDIHELNAHITSGMAVIQLIAAIVFTWRGRGRAWPIHASLALVLAEQAQVGIGYEGQVAVHVPLGVSIVAMQILLTVWLFRSAARTPRRRRVS